MDTFYAAPIPWSPGTYRGPCSLCGEMVDQTPGDAADANRVLTGESLADDRGPYIHYLCAVEVRNPPKGVLAFDYCADYTVPVRPWWRRWVARLRGLPTYERRSQSYYFGCPD